MRRREFITVFGATAAALPLAARAQQSAMPVIGFINAGSPDGLTDRVRQFRQGMKEIGYIEGENVTIEYRWGENQIDRVPALVTELIRRQVAVIVATGDSDPALAAKAGTTTIPIVFTIPEDPVRLGLVASLARPGGNATGINFFSNELIAKRLVLLRDRSSSRCRARQSDRRKRPSGIERRGHGYARHGTANPDSQRQHQPGHRCTYATFARERPDAVFVSGGSLFVSRRVQLVLLSARHAVPAPYGSREYAEIGGLMSYGTSLTDAYRQVGIYAGRISRVQNPRTCRLCRPPSSSLSSITRRQGYSASLCLQRCSPVPTR
jgi:putative tryptophan/tyrosine transport system substrate-binding protein